MGTPVQTAVDILSRPYPMAVAGESLKFSFDPETRMFDMEFIPSSDIQLPTIIFVPRHTYGSDMEVIVSDNLSYQVSGDNNQLLEIRLKEGEVSDGSQKSWVVLGKNGEINTVRTASTWVETFLSFIPFFRR